MKIPFSPPYIDQEVKDEVLQSLESGWITTGPKVLELERLVAQFTGVSRVVCCNSATSGLSLMLHWFGVKEGDEVIIPSYTYAATALVVMHTGAVPVMVDVGTDFNLDVTQLKARINERTKVIIPVDIGGWPCDYATIQEVVNDPNVKNKFKPFGESQQQLRRILILSDAAHSIGAVYKGVPVGCCADFTVFSFHAVKNITTAEGGAICINLPPDFDHETVYKLLKLWSLNGQTKDALSKTNGSGWRYDIVYPGFKMNMPDVCAAIGLAQLRKYQSEILPARRKIFDKYTELFSRFDWAEIPVKADNIRESACHLFLLRIRGITEEDRDAIIDQIIEQGVSVNVHFQPLPMLTVFRERGYQIADYPVAFDFYSREISLPIYPGLEAKVEYIVEAVVRSYNSVVKKNAQADI